VAKTENLAIVRMAHRTDNQQLELNVSAGDYETSTDKQYSEFSTAMAHSSMDKANKSI
jgi:hypothetical protein